MNEINEYGKSPYNPIKVNGVQASIDLLNSMLTEDDRPFLYHRIHTTSIVDSKPIDCYEIFTAKGETELLLISIDASTNDTSIPKGYKIRSESFFPFLFNGCLIVKTTGVNYKLKDFPNDILKII